MEKNFKVEKSTDVKKTPKRIAFIKGRTAARVKKQDEEMVMTFPHLVIREIIAFEVLIIALAIISLLVDAPLEWIANPEHTPNPAKAPWYFLGLQELLHYFPPVVAGVLLPTLAVVALVVIPYFRINIKSEGLWETQPKQTFVVLVGIVVFLSLILLTFSAYAMLVPTLIVTGFAVLPYFSDSNNRTTAWLRSRSLSWWIMTWFVVVTVVLTAIGTLFRGPEWGWTWPWEGIY